MSPSPPTASTSQEIRVGRRVIEASRLDKVLFPGDGITKGDLIAHYRRVADGILPHLKDRPLTMRRFPDGIGSGGFYQKEAPKHFPGWVRRVRVELRGGSSQEQVVCDDEATLAYLAEQACITPHPWLSRAPDLDCPDKLVFDLDPPEGGARGFAAVREGARGTREVLEDLGLVPLVMTTGSKGLHVVVALRGKRGFDEVREFARGVAGLVVARHPGAMTMQTRKDRRRGRLFLDSLRNAYAQTSVPPYAVRPLPGAPVATPLEWEELGRGGLHAQTYHLGNIARRLAQKGDPWGRWRAYARSLDKPMERLRALQEELQEEELQEAEQA